MLKLAVSIVIPAAIVVCLAVEEVQGTANVPAVSLPPKIPVCGPVCAIFCKCGNIPDERGCPTCRCRPCGPTVCPLLRCARPIKCPFGVKKENGCPTCQCNPGPTVCPLLRCARPVKCPFGVKKENGCPTCLCNPGPVDCSKAGCPPNVAIKCAYGVKIINGCPSCSCNPGPVCPKRRCTRLCKNGYKMVNGCQSCLCNPGPSSCPKIRCRPFRVCPFGRKTANGCPTCSCKRRLCPRWSSNQCRRRCPSGYSIRRLSRRGCLTCVCRRRSRLADIE